MTGNYARQKKVIYFLHNSEFNWIIYFKCFQLNEYKATKSFTVDLTPIKFKALQEWILEH